MRARFFVIILLQIVSLDLLAQDDSVEIWMNVFIPKGIAENEKVVDGLTYFYFLNDYYSTDNRWFSNDPSASSRISIYSKIDTEDLIVTDTIFRVDSTKALGQLSALDGTVKYWPSCSSKAVVDKTKSIKISNPIRSTDTLKINFVGNLGNPCNIFSNKVKIGEIDFDVSIHISKKKNHFTLDVSGSHDPFPFYELYYRYKGKTFLIYSQGNSDYFGATTSAFDLFNLFNTPTTFKNSINIYKNGMEGGTSQPIERGKSYWEQAIDYLIKLKDSLLNTDPNSEDKLKENLSKINQSKFDENLALSNLLSLANQSNDKTEFKARGYELVNELDTIRQKIESTLESSANVFKVEAKGASSQYIYQAIDFVARSYYIKKLNGVGWTDDIFSDNYVELDSTLRLIEMTADSLGLVDSLNSLKHQESYLKKLKEHILFILSRNNSMHDRLERSLEYSELFYVHQLMEVKQDLLQVQHSYPIVYNHIDSTFLENTDSYESILSKLIKGMNYYNILFKKFDLEKDTQHISLSKSNLNKYFDTIYQNRNQSIREFSKRVFTDYYFEKVESLKELAGDFGKNLIFRGVLESIGLEFDEIENWTTVEFDKIEASYTTILKTIALDSLLGSVEVLPMGSASNLKLNLQSIDSVYSTGIVAKYDLVEETKVTSLGNDVKDVVLQKSLGFELSNVRIDFDALDLTSINTLQLKLDSVEAFQTWLVSKGFSPSMLSKLNISKLTSFDTLHFDTGPIIFDECISFYTIDENYKSKCTCKIKMFDKDINTQIEKFIKDIYKTKLNLLFNDIPNWTQSLTANNTHWKLENTHFDFSGIRTDFVFQDNTSKLNGFGIRYTKNWKTGSDNVELLYSNRQLVRGLLDNIPFIEYAQCMSNANDCLDLDLVYAGKKHKIGQVNVSADSQTLTLPTIKLNFGSIEVEIFKAELDLLGTLNGHIGFIGMNNVNLLKENLTIEWGNRNMKVAGTSKNLISSFDVNLLSQELDLPLNTNFSKFVFTSEGISIRIDLSSLSSKSGECLNTITLSFKDIEAALETIVENKSKCLGDKLCDSLKDHFGLSMNRCDATSVINMVGNKLNLDGSPFKMVPSSVELVDNNFQITKDLSDATGVVFNAIIDGIDDLIIENIGLKVLSSFELDLSRIVVKPVNLKKSFSKLIEENDYITLNSVKLKNDLIASLNLSINLKEVLPASSNMEVTVNVDLKNGNSKIITQEITSFIFEQVSQQATQKILPYSIGDSPKFVIDNMRYLGGNDFVLEGKSTLEILESKIEVRFEIKIGDKISLHIKNRESIENSVLSLAKNFLDVPFLNDLISLEDLDLDNFTEYLGLVISIKPLAFGGRGIKIEIPQINIFHNGSVKFADGVESISFEIDTDIAIPPIKISKIGGSISKSGIELKGELSPLPPGSENVINMIGTHGFNIINGDLKSIDSNSKLMLLRLLEVAEANILVDFKNKKANADFYIDFISDDFFHLEGDGQILFETKDIKANMDAQLFNKSVNKASFHLNGEQKTVEAKFNIDLIATFNAMVKSQEGFSNPNVSANAGISTFLGDLGVRMNINERATELDLQVSFIKAGLVIPSPFDFSLRVVLDYLKSLLTFDIKDIPEALKAILSGNFKINPAASFGKDKGGVSGGKSKAEGGSGNPGNGAEQGMNQVGAKSSKSTNIAEGGSDPSPPGSSKQTGAQEGNQKGVTATSGGDKKGTYAAFNGKYKDVGKGFKGKGKEKRTKYKGLPILNGVAAKNDNQNIFYEFRKSWLDTLLNPNEPNLKERQKEVWAAMFMDIFEADKKEDPNYYKTVSTRETYLVNGNIVIYYIDNQESSQPKTLKIYYEDGKGEKRNIKMKYLVLKNSLSIQKSENDSHLKTLINSLIDEK